MRFFAAMFGAVTVASLLASSSVAQVVYSNNFETNTDGFSTSGTTSLPTTNDGFGSTPASTFLGRFGDSASTTLSLTGLTDGATYTVAFDLFIGASWDGNSTVAGPDRWSLTVGATSLVDTTFINLVPSDGILNDFTQNYSDGNPVGAGVSAALTGADVAQTTGGFFDRYGIYRFSVGVGNPVLTFTATGTTASLIFAGSGLQDVSDEFWAIDNVVVTTNASTAAPEPGALALLIPGLICVVPRRWKNQK